MLTLSTLRMVPLYTSKPPTRQRYQAKATDWQLQAHHSRELLLLAFLSMANLERCLHAV